LLFENSVGEVEANKFHRSYPCFDDEKVIVSRRRFVAKATLNDGENCVLLLPLEKCLAELSKEFSTGRFQDVKKTRVIDVVAQGTLGIAYAMRVLESHSDLFRVSIFDFGVIVNANW
jgi:hypothetical protein